MALQERECLSHTKCQLECTVYKVTKSRSLSYLLYAHVFKSGVCITDQWPQSIGLLHILCQVLLDQRRPSTKVRIRKSKSSLLI